MKTVLITGATGFIGQHLVQATLEAGYKVEALVRPKNPLIATLWKKGVEVIIGDITNYMAVEHAVNGVDLVFHLAGLVSTWDTRQRYTAVNEKGLQNLCVACWKRGTELLVNVSSSDVFGLQNRIMIGENQPYQKWGHPYPDSKIAAATIARQYSQKGLPLTTIYPCQVYGPGDRVFLPNLINALQKKRLFFWRKKALLWPTYVGNLVDLLMTVIHHPHAKNEDFLVHDGVSDTFEHFTSHIAQALNLNPPSLHLPYYPTLATTWLLEKTWSILEKQSQPPLTLYTVKHLGSYRQFSINKTRQLLDWNPPTPYETALNITLKDFKEKNNINETT